MRRFLLCILSLLLILCLAFPVSARVYIDITQPFSRKLPLALPVFQPLPGAETDPIGAKGARLLHKYLSYTALFEFLNPKSFLGPPQPGQVNYRRWSRIGAELLITGEYKLSGGIFTLELKLYDVGEAKLLAGRRYDGRPRDLGAMLARFSDEVMLALTDERSIFSTMIAFVGARDGKKEIYLTRFDGSGTKKLTNHQDIALYPDWSPNGELLTYSAFVKRRPAIFVHALAGGSGKVILNKPGVNLTPVFRPKHPGQIAAALSYTGKNNIFLVDLAGKVLKQLTSGWGIEVEPAFSPATTRSVFFETDDDGLPPSLWTSAWARSRVSLCREPVNTIDLPKNASDSARASLRGSIRAALSLRNTSLVSS